MTEEITLVLIGAAIALTSSIVTALVQHRLALRADKLKREWDENQKRAEALRNSLLQPDPTFTPIREEILKNQRRILPRLDETNSLAAEIVWARLRGLAKELNLDEETINKLIERVRLDLSELAEQTPQQR